MCFAPIDQKTRVGTPLGGGEPAGIRYIGPPQVSAIIVLSEQSH